MADQILDGYIPQDEYLAQIKRSRRWAREQRTLGKADPYVKYGTDYYYSIDGARKRLTERLVLPT